MISLSAKLSLGDPYFATMMVGAWLSSPAMAGQHSATSAKRQISRSNNGPPHDHEHLVLKGAMSLSLLKYAAAQRVQLESLLQLMKATVGTKMEYGLHLCMCASDPQQALTKLQRIQNQAMRLVTGAAKPPSNSC